MRGNMNVKLYRIKRGLTQDELAKKSGVCRNIISKAENGDFTHLRYLSMKSIAEALNVDVKKLFFEE